MPTTQPPRRTALPPEPSLYVLPDTTTTSLSSLPTAHKSTHFLLRGLHRGPVEIWCPAGVPLPYRGAPGCTRLPLYAPVFPLGGGCWVGLGEGLSWSPAHGPRRLPCRTRLGGCTRVSGHKAHRTVDRPQTTRWRLRAGDAAVLVCMCPCVSRGGGGGAVAHLLAPLLFGVGAHGAGKCVPGALGPGKEGGEPNAEPGGGDVGRGSQPPRHKDKLPNHSTTAYWHGKAVVRGTTAVRPALLDCLRHGWCCHAGWVRLPTAEGVPRAGGGAPGRRECFPALGATGAGCTGCGTTARVDKGAQSAPHPNGLSVEERGGGGRGWQVAVRPPRVAHNCTGVHGAVLA